ncbi:MAG: ACT domain-containing protein, partial [Gammaproteobacteria bacterium]|nr:ACT domain-containing protein [Gammaproteobacteria bacterium]NIT42303.1 ACT domain-containing protein [Gammaproteobacteria bacterium]
EVETAYYLRMQAIDKPGVLAEVTKILGTAGISIEAILQKEPLEGAKHVPIIFLTQCVQEKNMNAAIKQIEKLDVIEGEIMRIRMETLG